MNVYTNISGGGILPPSQNPTHDLNGNMLSGPVGTDAAVLTYDKENRLRTITQNGTTTGYTYDALSRCIESFNNNASPTDNRERYTWSGWTLLNREIFTGTSPTSSFRYTWGLDLSESLEGAGLPAIASATAGGVGGLLAIERIVGTNTDIRFPHYDANGNIIALTDSTGNVSARYRYDAFGKVLSATDLDSSNWVTHNIHGFSTKPTFGNPNLLYYGYRFYTPSTGRWINRDPIEERGGMNLYGFVGNDGVDNIDKHGNSILGTLCRASCAALGVAGCCAITAACAGLSAISFGGFVIPCSIAVPTACVASGGGAVICAEVFCQP